MVETGGPGVAQPTAEQTHGSPSLTPISQALLSSRTGLYGPRDRLETHKSKEGWPQPSGMKVIFLGRVTPHRKRPPGKREEVSCLSLRVGKN